MFGKPSSVPGPTMFNPPLPNHPMNGGGGGGRPPPSTTHFNPPPPTHSFNGGSIGAPSFHSRPPSTHVVLPPPVIHRGRGYTTYTGIHTAPYYSSGSYSCSSPSKTIIVGLGIIAVVGAIIFLVGLTSLSNEGIAISSNATVIAAEGLESLIFFGAVICGGAVAVLALMLCCSSPKKKEI